MMTGRNKRGTHPRVVFVKSAEAYEKKRVAFWSCAKSDKRVRKLLKTKEGQMAMQAV